MKVSEAMTAQVVTARPDTPISEVAQTMARIESGAVPIVEGGKVVGLVTDRDIVIRAIAVDRDPAQTTVGEVATQNPIVVSPDQPAAEAVQLMRDHALRRLPVCENGCSSTGSARHRAWCAVARARKAGSPPTASYTDARAMAECPTAPDLTRRARKSDSERSHDREAC